MRNLYFDLVGVINDESFAGLLHFINSQRESISSLTLNICSLGGNVASGIGMYNFLKNLSFPIHTHNMGEVTSAAILPYLSGKIRTAEPISKFMLHPITIGINSELPYHKVQEILRGIDLDIKNFGKIISTETNSLNGQCNIENLLKSDSLVLDLSAAYKYGIVTKM